MRTLRVPSEPLGVVCDRTSKLSGRSIEVDGSSDDRYIVRNTKLIHPVVRLGTIFSSTSEAAQSTVCCSLPDESNTQPYRMVRLHLSSTDIPSICRITKVTHHTKITTTLDG